MKAKGLETLRTAWRRQAGGSLGLGLGAASIAVTIAGAYLARAGTLPSRLAAAAAIAVAAIVWVSSAVRERRAWRDSERTLRRVLLRTDPSLGQRALRALKMRARAEKDERIGDPELARLHFERLLSRASVDAIEGAASRYANLWRSVAALFLCASTLAVLVSPLHVLEGLDVLAAVDGKAPVPITYLRYPRVTAQPPSYTRHVERSLVLGSRVLLPAGTVVTIRGTPRGDPRELVVTDGTGDVPFVSDGAGGLVARYTVADTTRIRIAARFGDVRIEEAESLEIESIEDMPPAVRLAGAPRTLQLAEVDRIDVRWAARDDYGIRQVDLVLRSGAQEERRVLARFDGATTDERGAHSLRGRDAFLRRAFLPVEIRIEVRDNDPMDSNWGRSEALVVVPPAAGEPEALRYQALASVRDALVDYLAWLRNGDVELAEPPSAAEVKRRAKTLNDDARRVLEKTYGGLTVPQGLQSFLLGQLRRLGTESRNPDTAADALLGADAALRSLGTRDAQAVSKRLGDVAEEVATSARLARETEQRVEGLRRADIAIDALTRGVKWLSMLGVLGQDLGGVASGDLGRIRRSRGRDDLTHTELAALHLAARLRRPNPSFGASGGRGSVEAGAGSGRPQPGTGVPPSDADNAFDRLAQRIAELAEEHGDALGGVERVLEEAADGADLEELKDEAAERARAVRAAVDPLPPPGEEPGSRRAAEALGREHANAMAHALEQLEFDSAIQSGTNALSSLEQALKRDGFGSVADSEVAGISSEVRKHLDWAKTMLDHLRASAEARAREPLVQSGKQERELAERAERLANEGQSGEAPLPEDVLDRLERAESAMKQAARALSEGRGQEGLEHQRDAQRLLEQAETGKTSDAEDAERGGDESETTGPKDAEDIATGGEVPAADERARAEEFRERVLKGLAREKSDRMSPAVKRYAEGLLR